MLNLAVLYGSRSCEHEVSIITAVQLMHHADKAKYNVIPVYISPEGVWYTGEALMDIAFYKKFDASKLTKVYLTGHYGDNILWTTQKGLFGEKKVAYAAIDAAIPAFHGMNGEDGTIQGLLELADIPYTSSALIGSAVGMDKIAMKQLFRGAGLPVLESLWFERGDFEQKKAEVIKAVEEKLGYPVFVKPANLGSSIGINRSDDAASLEYALEVAFSYDRRVIVEHGVSKCKEINCSAMGYADDVAASLCEQPVTWQEMLSFQDKYLGNQNEAKKGMQSMSRLIPAPISEEMTARIQQMSVEIFKLMDCKGVVRIDYIIDEEDSSLYVNEINTIPGSFAFYLWEPLGIPYSAMIDRLVGYAKRSHDEKHKNTYVFQSEILSAVSLGGAKGAKGTKGAK